MANIDYSIKDIEKVVKFDGRINNVEVTRLTPPGENFIGLVLKVDFEVEKNGESKIISSVAKRMPKSSMPFIMDGYSMRNEILWYTEIVPVLKNFAKENNIDLDIYPEFFGSRYSLDPEKKQADIESVLLLENLIPQGYHNEDRYIGFDLDTSRAALKALALFHALPIAIKVKNPELYKVFEDYFEKCCPAGPPKESSDSDEKKEPPPRPEGVRRPHEIMLDKLSTVPDFAPYKSKVQELFEKAYMGLGDEKKLADEPWNTVKHGDFWVNNIMVNHQEGGKPLIKIVDFQSCFYGTFANDVVFFLLTSVINDVTKEHMDDLLKLYYDEFTSVLRNTNVEEELTYEAYIKEVGRAARRTEVAHALFFSTIIFGEKGTAVDIAVEEFDPSVHISRMAENMNQYQKDKVLMMAVESVKRNWL